MTDKKKDSLRNLQDRREKLFEELRVALKDVYDAFNFAVQKRTGKAWSDWIDCSVKYENLYNELVRIEDKICILNAVANASNIKEKTLKKEKIKKWQEENLKTQIV